MTAGCARLLLSESAPPAPDRLPPGVELRAGSLESVGGCRFDHQLFLPSGAALGQGRPLVVLGHGFLRSPARMRDLALALAADGIPAATLEFCNMRPWRGAHTRNARDMTRLARSLEAEQVIYAGFSAGALAALLAARLDPSSLGVLALDLVDAGGLGRRAADGLRQPLIGLSGEPTNCNARGNGGPIFANAPNGRHRRIAGAGHCDFESPTDALCRLVCRDPDGAAPARQAEIIAAAAAEVRALVDARGASRP